MRVGWERVPSELGREADIDKAFTRAHVEWKHTRTQTNWRQMDLGRDLENKFERRDTNKKEAKTISVTAEGKKARAKSVTLKRKKQKRKA